jgi:hypothetical protein
VKREAASASFALACAWSLAVSLVAGAAQASEPPREVKRVRLVYTRGAGADRRPDADALRAAVSARLGYEPFDDDATTTVSATLSRGKRDRVVVFVTDWISPAQHLGVDARAEHHRPSIAVDPAAFRALFFGALSGAAGVTILRPAPAVQIVTIPLLFPMPVIVSSPPGPRSAVKVNPFGALFSTSPGSLGPAFQADFVANQVPLLVTNKINRLTMATPLQFDAGQSTEQGTSNDYRTQITGNTAFLNAIQTKLTALGSGLSPQNIADRATTQSCAGCHQLTNNKDLGGDVVWPSSNLSGFTHISESGQMSPALTGTFLPFRKRGLQNFLCGTLDLSESASNTIGGAAVE